MDTLMEIRQMKPENITIRCRNKTNRLRIIVLTLAFALVCWLVHGITCTVLDRGVTFWQGLVSPASLLLLVLETVIWFFVHLKRNTDH